ncbi:MAG: kinase-like domain-containing protein [Monoraphidium minutum]|nr:MAG: kinase-like domain-containing protein [Monoraphidium minutum]
MQLRVPMRAAAPRARRDKYVRATLVSYGASCKVFTAAQKSTGEPVAIKIIKKEPGGPGADAQRGRVMREVGATRLLQGHPHAVRLLDVFEDGKAFHLVMEMLAGGELFDHISAEGALTEARAAAILRSLCLLLAHAHAQGIAHMDVKPENIMFDAGGPEGVLKVIDLGSAEFLMPEQLAARAFGTVRYSSPEMARDMCGQRSDVWSAGVVMYQMLAGRVPFLKDTDAATLALLQRGPDVKFPGSRWRNISEPAKDCIRRMLDPDPKQRPTASQVLQHPWLAADAPRTAIDASILHQLQLFASLNRARRLMLGVAARVLSGSEASALLRKFLALDKDFNGTLDLKELSEAARQVAPDISEAALGAMFTALDVDNTGSVDAQEFFAAVLSTSLHPAVNESVIERSFKTLDRGANGFITKQDLRHALSLSRPAAFEGGGAPGIDEFAAMDANGDGVVTLDEFKSAMRSLSMDHASSLRSLDGPAPPSSPAAAARTRGSSSSSSTSSRRSATRRPSASPAACLARARHRPARAAAARPRPRRWRAHSRPPPASSCRAMCDHTLKKYYSRALLADGGLLNTYAPPPPPPTLGERAGCPTTGCRCWLRALRTPATALTNAPRPPASPGKLLNTPQRTRTHH